MTFSCARCRPMGMEHDDFINENCARCGEFIAGLYMDDECPGCHEVIGDDIYNPMDDFNPYEYL